MSAGEWWEEDQSHDSNHTVNTSIREYLPSPSPTIPQNQAIPINHILIPNQHISSTGCSPSYIPTASPIPSPTLQLSYPARTRRNQPPSPQHRLPSANPSESALSLHCQVIYQNQCEKTDIEIPVLDLWDLRLQIYEVVNEIHESDSGEKLPFDKSFQLEYKLSNEAAKGEWNRLPGEQALRVLEAEIREHEGQRRRGLKALTIRFRPRTKNSASGDSVGKRVLKDSQKDMEEGGAGKKAKENPPDPVQLTPGLLSYWATALYDDPNGITGPIRGTPSQPQSISPFHSFSQNGQPSSAVPMIIYNIGQPITPQTLPSPITSSKAASTNISTQQSTSHIHQLDSTRHPPLSSTSQPPPPSLLPPLSPRKAEHCEKLFRMSASSILSFLSDNDSHKRDFNFRVPLWEEQYISPSQIP
ncbi:hypothetical protein L873DRAFT_1847092 [Choiromyces venosus 120613-1]|uniref:Uncharacterized protein n=1 Tax=Choiromyces venosus 120613-1 TaxID=1336337 RepID=A0A3N4J8I9_9PEZI|nr:hypothetical protein L873DRAFT_1847092 [Choiromyces venosus 120613-1]